MTQGRPKNRLICYIAPVYSTKHLVYNQNSYITCYIPWPKNRSEGYIALLYSMLHSILYSRCYEGSSPCYITCYIAVWGLFPPYVPEFPLGREPKGCPCTNPGCFCTFLFSCFSPITWGKGRRLGNLKLWLRACCWWREPPPLLEALLRDLPTLDDANEAACMTIVEAVEVS